MGRLTKQNGCKEYFVEDYYDISGRRYGQEIDKLGRLEDTFEIMEKMKTTPVIWKLENGNTIEKSFNHHQILYDTTHNSIEIYIYERVCSLKMEEYKKTWWLKGDMKNGFNI